MKMEHKLTVDAYSVFDSFPLNEEMALYETLVTVLNSLSFYENLFSLGQCCGSMTVSSQSATQEGVLAVKPGVIRL